MNFNLDPEDNNRDFKTSKSALEMKMQIQVWKTYLIEWNGFKARKTPLNNIPFILILLTNWNVA